MMLLMIDDDDDDVNDGNNRSSIPSNFLTSSSFLSLLFASTLPSAFTVSFPSVPSAPSSPFIPSVSSTLFDPSVLSAARFTPPPNKFQLTSAQGTLTYSDLIGDVETYP
jgi:hypothetical protein